MNWKDPQFYQRNISTIPSALAAGLIEGQLTLLIGAGVSQGFKLPSWKTLVIDVCEQLNPIIVARGRDAIDISDINDTTSGNTLLRKIASARMAVNDDPTYLQTVKDVLYRRWKHPTIFAAPSTLRAVAMLITGSRRGRIEDVINFNFDSVLEWYLAEHGLVPSVIEDLPKNSVTSDVRIYHPHGYLPKDASLGLDSGMILFDEKVARERLANRDDPWMDLYRSLLSCRKFLAIGLGFNDPMVDNALTAASLVRKNLSVNEPLGFWIYREGSLKREEIDSLNALNVVAIAVQDFRDIGKYLQEIAKLAAAQVKF